MSSGTLAGKVLQKENHLLSVDDLEQALELTDKDDIKEEEKMLQGIIRFGDETAKEVMTSRQDIVALDIKSPFSEVLNCIIENNYSRIPIYQDNSDNIRGILYIKDLLPHLSKPTNFRWQSLIRPPYFVPETKKIDDLLREFQDNKVHIAIVVDEFGGTAGIVTMEDVVEEIFGEIDDEYDVEEEVEKVVDDNTFVFSARLEIDYLNDTYKLDLPVSDDYETLAGMILHYCESIPEQGQVLQIGNYQVKILKASHMKLDEVELKIQNK